MEFRNDDEGFEADDDYEVGYRKPPRGSRFKRGQSRQSKRKAAWHKEFRYSP
jgi:hypothetical protein